MALGMEKKHWQKIQKNLEYLKAELQIGAGFLDDLRSCPSNVLSLEDAQRIKYEQVDADKTEKLLLILKRKPTSVNAYKSLLGVVKKHQDYVFHKLENTEVDDTEVKDDPSRDVKVQVRHILLEKFVDEQGKSCSLPEVKKVVGILRGRQVNFDWRDEELQKFVVEIFSGVIFEPGRKRNPFSNLGSKDLCPIVPMVLTLSETIVVKKPATIEEITSEHVDEIPDVHYEKDIKSMTTEELVQYLKPMFTSLSLDEKFVIKFRDLEIDGTVFSTMKEQDFKDEFSHEELTFGKRRKLMLEIDKIMEEAKMGKKPAHLSKSSDQVAASLGNTSGMDPEGAQTSAIQRQAGVAGVEEPPAYKDHFRRFDTPVAPTDKYVSGRLIEVAGFCRENMINPVRKFMKVDDAQDIYRKIAEETIRFASACMNDRTNGTLYVGINPLSKDNNQHGTVVGIVLDKEKCEDTIRLHIAEKYFEDQHEIAFKAIRSTKFIEVLNSARPNAWIVEIDVVPLATLVKDQAFFVRGMSARKEKKKQHLYRLVEGSVKALSDKELFEFMNKKKDLTEMRKQQEIRTADSYIQPDLRKQILNLFTGGSETIEDEIYPVLMTSPLDHYMDAEYVRENLSFIQHFDAKAVFDFDPNNNSSGLYDYFSNKGEQIYEVQTTDNFDKNADEYSEKLLESLKTSTERSWIFCNGYSHLRKQKMNAFEWKQNRSDGFKDALRFFHSSIPLGRGIVLIFLFSSNYEALLEAADEVILKFKDQWMAIAETEEIANLWKDELLRRNVVSKNSLNERFVIGMPWRHVNATFSQIISPRQSIACELPTSTGAFCILKERDRVDMNDLDILSRNECDADEELQERHYREIKRRSVEEKFFRGAPVQWINFWFRDDHILKRKQNKDLKELVERYLTTAHRDDDEKVRVVTLMHQPGAGGTTSSKQVLWDLREQYRCCVVKKITDDTASQIVTLRNYDEKGTKKPPLVLIDNEDEDKFRLLLLQLEEKAKIASRNEEESFKVFCTVLLCMRRVNLTRSHEGDKILLKHELQPWELSWFQKKYETLEKKFREDRKVDPKLLISFNILKTNFDPEYIKRTVAEYMKEVDDTKELVLMKYLSLINSYDMDYQTIPVSAFDSLVGVQTKQKRIMQFGILQKDGSRSKGWETTMSTSVRVLVNESSQRGAHGTRIKTIRITSALLAKEILAYITKTNHQSVSEIMLEFMTSSIFDCENSSTHKLLNIVKNLIKRRVKKKDGRPDKFSPLILDVTKQEGSEVAADICVGVYKKTEDPMIAQQIARFFIHTKNWLEAEKYARICTSKMPKNSFLWDTYGQVYKEQLREHYDRARSGVKISNNDASEIMLLAQRAIETFRKEQVLSETEKSLIINHGGYIGELRVIFQLLNIVCHFESLTNMEQLHRYLVDKKYTPESLSFLDREEHGMLKSLGEAAFKAIRKLEDEQVQLKSDSRDEFKDPSYYDQKTLVILKENVNTFFGEDSDEVPSSLSDEDACEYRRRRVKRLGVTSLQGAMALKYEGNGVDALTTVYDLMAENVVTKSCTTFDLVTILNTVIALHVARSPLAKDIPYQKIVEWSSQLYAAKQPEERPYLESFLYLVMFNLPSESRRKHGYRLCSEVRIQEALGRWREAFFNNYPKHRDNEWLARRKDTTLFFLGRGSGLQEMVYQREVMSRGEKMRDVGFWQSESAKKIFQRLEGTLLMGGTEVQVQLQHTAGNKFHITIPTSLVTKKRSMWQKRVFFVLGFSWSGPKAYNITLENPSDGFEDGGERYDDSGSKPSVLRGLQIFTLKLADIESATSRAQKELKSLEGKQRLSSEEKGRKQTLRRKLEELQRAREELLGDGLD